MVYKLIYFYTDLNASITRMGIGSVVVWPKKRSTNLVNNTIEGAKVRVLRFRVGDLETLFNFWGFRVEISKFEDGNPISKSKNRGPGQPI